MTADEILNTLEDIKTEKGWLKELCYQVALSNELAVAQAIKEDLPKFMPPPAAPIAEIPRQKRKYNRRQIS